MKDKTMYILLVLAAIVVLAHSTLHTKADNPAEQLVEKAIKAETGIDIDLTPEEGEGE